MGFDDNVHIEVRILGKIIEKLSLPDCDVVWSHYESQTDAIVDIQDHIDRLKNGDYSRYQDLKLLFAPTGSLQEISLSNDWADEFLELAKQFNRAVEGMF
jgi:hypothetical protein